MESTLVTNYGPSAEGALSFLAGRCQVCNKPGAVWDLDFNYQVCVPCSQSDRKNDLWADPWPDRRARRPVLASCGSFSGPGSNFAEIGFPENWYPATPRGIPQGYPRGTPPGAPRGIPPRRSPGIPQGLRVVANNTHVAQSTNDSVDRPIAKRRNHNLEQYRATATAATTTLRAQLQLRDVTIGPYRYCILCRKPRNSYITESGMALATERSRKRMRTSRWNRRWSQTMAPLRKGPSVS
jgi:hypothetical protein